MSGGGGSDLGGDVEHLSRGQDYIEADVAQGKDPGVVLQAALARNCRIRQFEIADPSLEQIFIEHVGQFDTTERTLAPSTVNA